jgi:RNA polymerase sigma-70 factor (ECF subfamily)
MENREQVFKSWIDRHKGLLFKVIRAYASTLDDQDDLFQEILLQLWQSIPRYRGDAKETTWIYRVALNTALVWVRTQKRLRKKHERILADVVEQQRIPAAPNNTARDEQLVECLYQAIRQLPVIDASLMLLHLDGVSYEDMAEVLGITKNHVGVRLNRAKKKLGEIMEGVNHEL